jgi:hypothetical protein
MEHDAGLRQQPDAAGWPAADLAAANPAAADLAAPDLPEGSASAEADERDGADEVSRVPGSHGRGYGPGAGPGDEPGGWGGREPADSIGATGEPRVDEALSGLRELARLPVAEHPAHFERAHRQLREALGDIEGGQRPAAQGRGGS